MGGQNITIIRPNIPDSWIKQFKFSGTHQFTTIKKAVDVLEILESNKKFNDSHKERKCHLVPANEQQMGAGTNTKSKNTRKYSIHPNAKHEWKDCIQSVAVRNTGDTMEETK